MNRLILKINLCSRLHLIIDHYDGSDQQEGHSLASGAATAYIVETEILR